MKKQEVYLDNNATTKMNEEVIKIMTKVMLENYGNPSSVYRLGQKSKKIIEEAREVISGLLGVKSREIVFTSGGTEANNMAIRGIANAMLKKGNHIISSNIEHSSVMETLEDLERKGFEVTYVESDKDGIVHWKEVEKAIKPETTLITIMHSNNELGTIQPIQEISEIARKNDIYLHVDAVQSMGKTNINMSNMDTMTFSAHKFYGPKGAGVLYVKGGTKIDKFVTGGHQERNRRGGTENTPAIAGMGKALEIALGSFYEEMEREAKLKKYLEERLSKEIKDTKINGKKSTRLSNTTSLTIAGVEAEGIMMGLDMRGIAVSAGAACASSTLTPSHVLEAIKLNKKELKGSIRISLGKDIDKEKIDYFILSLKEVIKIERDMENLI